MDTAAAVPLPTFGSYLQHCRGTIRREQLAVDAQVSVGYLTKLEQGTKRQPSAEIVERLATSLRLNPDQRHHLHDLVHYQTVTPGSVADHRHPIEIDEPTRAYVDRLVPHPAAYLGPAAHLLYGNTEYTRIFRRITEPAIGNLVRWLFLIPQARAIVLDWDDEARLTVARLRAQLVRHPGSVLFGQLLDSLSTSTDFTRMWARQEVRLSRTSPHLWLRDLDHNQTIDLLAEIHDVPAPHHQTHHQIQRFLGVRDSDTTGH